MDMDDEALKLTSRRRAAPVLAVTLLALATAAPSFAGAQDPPPPKRIYTTRHVNPHAPVIDGKAGDPAWEEAEWQGDFVQREPFEGAAPTERTDFKIVYDDKALYVLIRAADARAGTIERRVARRDSIDGDWVDITLDSYFDHLTGFCFGVNAGGVKADQLLSNGGLNDTDKDSSWDPIWDVATSTDDGGWTAEMRIPFSQLRFGNRPEHVWGLQITRRLFRNDETSAWQAIPKSSPGWVHMFGELRGIAGIRPPRQIEMVPYTVGKLMTARRVPDDPFHAGRGSSLLGGLDGKIGVTHDLTLNFTVNPDFGQVEADPSVVNLTAFETYYAEKRPFFIEGRNILSFGFMGGNGDNSGDNLFYTRRIGRAPQVLPEGGTPIDAPEATTILGAFKLTGKTRRGLSIGVLESVTSREMASVFDLGSSRDVAVEPLTNYFAVRVQKDYNRAATIVGGMLTAVNRRLDGSSADVLRDAAYTGGLDLFHSWKDKTWFVSFRSAFSSVHGSPAAILLTQKSPLRYYQRADATHLRLDPTRTSLSGYGGTLEAGKQGGGHWTYIAGVNWRSPGFELNDMGFLNGADDIMQYALAGYRVWEPKWVFREYRINFNEWTGWDFSGRHMYGGGNVNAHAQFRNYWTAALGLNRNAANWSPSALRGGPALAQPGIWLIWANLGTDSRKKARFELYANAGRRDNGELLEAEFEAGVTLVPNKALSLSLSPNFSSILYDLQYVGEASFGGEPRYLFGRIDEKTAGLTVRLNYSLTPDLSIQFYGQPFIASGRYSRFKRITDPATRDYANRFRVFGTGEIGRDAAGAYSIDEDGDGRPDYGFDDPDFNVLEFRSNLVVRWEYIPGSALFFVWSQGRDGLSPAGEFAFGRNVRDLFGTHPRDVFLIKFSYCFQL